MLVRNAEKRSNKTHRLSDRARMSGDNEPFLSNDPVDGYWSKETGKNKIIKLNSNWKNQSFLGSLVINGETCVYNGFPFSRE